MSADGGWAIAAPDEPTPALDVLAELGVLREGVYPDGRRFYEVTARAAWPADGRDEEREAARQVLEEALRG